jgi:hypothetical protein
VRVYWLIRWFAWEFLALPHRGDLSSWLVAVSRVVGCGAIYGVLHVALSGGVAADFAAAAVQWISSIALALALGNVARECTASVAARLSVSLGREFRRKGATLNGRTYVEAFHADGTWMRCVIGPEDTVCEWTDSYGACNKVVTRPVRARRPH